MLGLPDYTDEELLAVLICSGYRGKKPIGQAKEVLDKYGSLSGIMGRKLYDMARLKGLGDVKVVRIAAAYEIVRRMVKLLEAE